MQRCDEDVVHDQKILEISKGFCAPNNGQCAGFIRSVARLIPDMQCLKSSRLIESISSRFQGFIMRSSRQLRVFRLAFHAVSQDRTR